MEMLPARAPERWGFDGAGHPQQGNRVKTFRLAATPQPSSPRRRGPIFGCSSGSGSEGKIVPSAWTEGTLWRTDWRRDGLAWWETNI